MAGPRKWQDEKAFAYVKARLDRGEYIDMHSFLEEDPEGKMAYWYIKQGLAAGVISLRHSKTSTILI